MKKKNWYFYLNFNQYYKMHIKKDITISVSHKTKLNKIKINFIFLKEKSEIKLISLKIYLIIEQIVKTIGIYNILKYNIVTTHIINIITNDSIEKYIRGQVNSTIEKQVYKSNSVLLLHDNSINDLKEKTTIYKTDKMNKDLIFYEIINILHKNIMNTLHQS